MELFEKTIEYDSRSVPFNIVFTGDWHLGHGGCDRKKILKTIDIIKNMKNVLVIFMGDSMECISPTDKRFDAYSMDEEFLGDLGRLIDRQYEEVVKILSPIKEKILLIHEGNHEQGIRKKYFRDIVLDLCRELRTKTTQPLYGQISAITRLKFKHKAGGKVRTFDILSCHGFGGGRKKGAKLNNLTDMASSFRNIDIYSMGHTHELFIVPHTKLGLNKRGKLKLTEQNIWLINTGGYLKTYEEHVVSYTENSMYPASPLGCAGIRIYPAEKIIEGYYVS